jgi:hypothetical protein
MLKTVNGSKTPLATRSVSEGSIGNALLFDPSLTLRVTKKIREAAFTE